MRRRQFSDDGVHWVDDDDDDTAFGVHVHTRLIDVAETTTVRDGEVSVFRHSETAPAPVVYDGEMRHISTAHASMDEQGRITLHPDAVSLDEGEHPAPWRWEGHASESTYDYEDALLDSNGDVVLFLEQNSIGVPTTRVRALTEAAPLMEALLIRFVNPGPELVSEQLAEARAILAQIEERSRG